MRSSSWRISFTHTIKNVGPAASAASLFVATNGNIGRINVAIPVQRRRDRVGVGGSPRRRLRPGQQSEPQCRKPLLGDFRAIRNPQHNHRDCHVAHAADCGVYGSDDTLYFQVNFSRSVVVFGQPSFPVVIGSTMRGTLVSGSGSSQLLFSLTIDPGDQGNVTIHPAATTIQTDIDNRIADSSTNEEITNSPAVGNTSGILCRHHGPYSHDNKISATGPRHGLLIGRRENPSTVIVTFSEAAIVQGSPTMGLTIGKLSVPLVYNSGSGSNVLRFTYKPTSRCEVREASA